LTALANRVSHPKNVYLREADVLGRVDDWLAELFGPARIDTTLSQLTEQAAQLQDPAALDRAEAARTRIAEYDAEISQYRASLKAGGDPAVIGPWIAETQAKKVAAQADIRTATGQSQMSRDEIAAIVTALGDLAHVVSTAEPADKSEIYAQLGLALTYQPGERLVEATIRPGQTMRKGFVSEGGLEHIFEGISRIRGNHEVSITGKIPCPPGIGVPRMAPDLVPRAGPERAIW